MRTAAFYRWCDTVDTVFQIKTGFSVYSIRGYEINGMYLRYSMGRTPRQEYEFFMNEYPEYRVLEHSDGLLYEEVV
jgi:hypothetical protein